MFIEDNLMPVLLKSYIVINKYLMLVRVCEGGQYTSKNNVTKRGRTRHEIDTCGTRTDTLAHAVKVWPPQHIPIVVGRSVVRLL